MASKQETPGQLKQRHKLELRNLQNDIKTYQKKAKKDKLSKKDTEAQVALLESALKTRHDDELAALETEETDDDATTVTTVAAPAAATSLEPPVKQQGPTKAQRRREKLKQQEKERDARIAEANKHTVSLRQIEADAIAQQLAPLGLVLKDIPSDGHCMYHAVADQMQQRGLPLVAGRGGLEGKQAQQPAFQSLRRLTSDYMRTHPDDFVPFLALEEEEDRSDSFARYCDRVAHSSDWGGQLELRALACALEWPIHVFAAESDVIRMGDEFVLHEEDEKAPLQLTYHLHYYTLGEHFNSVAPRK